MGRLNTPLLMVSACLAGFKCRYDGRSKTYPKASDFVARGQAIPVCPERLGGLPVPRSAVEIYDGSGEDVLSGRAKVLTKEGKDRTDFLVKGAAEVVWLAKLLGVKKAILKERSPSCGYKQIYDGSFKGHLRPGSGVAAAALLKAGVEVFSEEELNTLD